VVAGETLTIPKVLAGTGGLNKTGAGALFLAGDLAQGYAGSTTVTEGTLIATGSVTGALVVEAGGTIAPGATTGTFTAGATTLAGTYQCEIDGAVADKIVVSGDVTLSPGAEIEFSDLGGGATAAFYPILTSTGTISGPLPTVIGAPSGYTLEIISGSALVLSQGDATVGGPVLSLLPPSAPGATEDFSTSAGGFSASATAPPESEWTYTAGSWRSNAQATGGFGSVNTSYLTSPVYKISQAGPVTLTFSHRYSFEQGYYDGGAVEVSKNGGAFTRVETGSFSQNPYNGTLLPDTTAILAGQEAFVLNSPGHPAYITSVCTIGTAVVGDLFTVRFVSASDENTSGNLTPQGWQIDSVQVSGGSTSFSTLSWEVGTMQYSDNLQPPWTDLEGTSPLLIDTNAAPRRFFRMKP
jgi:autotransporter-associated beta strand protein